MKILFYRNITAYSNRGREDWTDYMERFQNRNWNEMRYKDAPPY